jgi:signal transduction histidine kinase
MFDPIRRTIGERIDVETVLAAGLWSTSCDPSEFENALLNLAVKARDAMPSGGKLTIETANTHLDEEYARQYPEVKPGEYVMLAVTDTGVGMDKETLDHAFEPFFTTKEVGRGTGLGLSMVFGFVKQSDGHINVYSEPSQGTSIKLYLPRHVGAGQADEPAAQLGAALRANRDAPCSSPRTMTRFASPSHGACVISATAFTRRQMVLRPWKS